MIEILLKLWCPECGERVRVRMAAGYTAADEGVSVLRMVDLEFNCKPLLSYDNPKDGTCAGVRMELMRALKYACDGIVCGARVNRGLRDADQIGEALKDRLPKKFLTRPKPRKPFKPPGFDAAGAGPT